MTGGCSGCRCCCVDPMVEQARQIVEAIRAYERRRNAKVRTP